MAEQREIAELHFSPEEVVLALSAAGYKIPRGTIRSISIGAPTGTNEVEAGTERHLVIQFGPVCYEVLSNERIDPLIRAQHGEKIRGDWNVDQAPAEKEEDE